MITAKKYYVVCPANGRTGGLELLHQLTHSLVEQGVNASIAYINETPGQSPLNEAYRRYIKRFVYFKDIPDSAETVVILPEEQVNLVPSFEKAKVVVWWLSVDNYFKMYNARSAYQQLGFKGVLWFLKNRRWRYSLSMLEEKVDYSLAQSYYAEDFLNSHGFKNVEYLSDYISLDYLGDSPLNEYPREDVVLYNPKKGIKFTRKLMSAAPNIKWVPLINMTNEQVLKSLKTSKVYIDFGNHPGKDRFPREAAISGCCVITGKKGSANFYKDVPIPAEFKHLDDEEVIPTVIDQIHQVFADFESEQKKFSQYREMIQSEPSQFQKDVKHVFIESENI